LKKKVVLPLILPLSAIAGDIIGTVNTGKAPTASTDSVTVYVPMEKKADVSNFPVFDSYNYAAPQDILRSFAPKLNSAGTSAVSPRVSAITQGDAANTQGIYGGFNSTRLYPRNAGLQPPYKAVGQLFFTQRGVGYVCSASVISYRVVVTAGHCVHAGNKSATGWSSNYRFYPTKGSGATGPLAGPWTSWGIAITTTEWYNSGGIVPNNGDYAVITFNEPVGWSRLGLYTGTFGVTVNAGSDLLKAVGYPCNIDSCAYMHQVDAQTVRSSLIFRMSSDMRGGSSGGPWVSNFGYAGTGQPYFGARNRVVAVTSFGPVATNSYYQGASVFDSRMTSMINSACAHRVGNCTP
jgi:V8-like Glu-specific endopeptidase